MAAYDHSLVKTDLIENPAVRCARADSCGSFLWAN
jgi:hypothetical protein